GLQGPDDIEPLGSVLASRTRPRLRHPFPELHQPEEFLVAHVEHWLRISLLVEQQEGVGTNDLNPSGEIRVNRRDRLLRAIDPPWHGRLASFGASSTRLVAICRWVLFFRPHVPL